MNNLKFLFCSLVVTSLPVLAAHECAENPYRDGCLVQRDMQVSELQQHEQQQSADDWQNAMADSLNQKEANRIKANAAENKAMMDENHRAIEERNREIEAVRRYNRELDKGR